MFCSNCGSATSEDAAFCASCGAALGVDTSGHAAHELAGRWSRLGAKVIDGFVLLVTYFTFFRLLAAGVEDPAALVFLAGFAAVVPLLQVVWLSKDGQTIGKKALNTRVVSVTTGLNAGFMTNVALRAWLNAGINIVPLYALVDVLLIFREDKRCVHDLIAGTKVVKA